MYSCCINWVGLKMLSVFYSVEDICNIATSTNIKEITIDGNPVFLTGDCTSFLVSYLPHLAKLNGMQINDQV